jgi:hypothetical protein
MTKPILYDLCRASKHIHSRPSASSMTTSINQLMALGMREAVPFVIDNDTLLMAQYLRDEVILDPKICLPDLAVLPYPMTFIEYDPIMLLQPSRRSADMAGRFGHIIGRDGSGMWMMALESFGKDVFIAPYTVTVCDAGLVAPVRSFVGERHTPMSDNGMAFRQIMLTGTRKLPVWAERVGGDTYVPSGSPKAVMATMDHMTDLLREHASSVSLTLAIMTLIAHVPTRQIVVSPSGRWVSAKGGTTAPYHRHTVVRIEMGERQVYQAVRNAAADPVHRGLHDVREHWRTYNRGKPNEYRVKIAKHQRGDEKYGIITHDHYETVRIKRERSPWPK